MASTLRPMLFTSASLPSVVPLTGLAQRVSWPSWYCLTHDFPGTVFGDHAVHR